MGFDLESATPVQSGGFDLQSAKPVESEGFDLSSATPVSSDQTDLQSLKGDLGASALQPFKDIYGVGETALGMLSSIPAMAAGGLRGITSLATGSSGPEAVGNVKQSADLLTFEPRTPEGKEFSKMAGHAFEKAIEVSGDVVAGGRKLSEGEKQVYRQLGMDPELSLDDSMEALRRTLGEAGFEAAMAAGPLKGLPKAVRDSKLRIEDTNKAEQLLKAGQELEARLLKEQQDFSLARQTEMQGEGFDSARPQPDTRSPYNLSPEEIARLEAELNPAVEQRKAGQGELFSDYAKDDLLLGEEGKSPRSGEVSDFQRDQPKLTEQDYYGPTEDLLGEMKGGQEGARPLEFELPKTVEEVTGKPGFLRSAEEVMQARETQRFLDQIKKAREDASAVGSEAPKLSEFNYELTNDMMGRLDKQTGKMTDPPRTVRPLLERLRDSTTNPFYKELSKFLLEKKDFNPFFELVEKTVIEGKEVAGLYRGSEYKIQIPHRSAGIESVLLHESVHAHTHSIVEGVLRGDASFTKFRPEVRALENLWKTFKEEGSAKHYGLETLHEFIAEGFTNPTFQAFLASKPLPKGNTFKVYFNKFITTVSKLLGFGDGVTQSKINGLSELLKNGASIIDRASTKDRMDLYQKYSKDISKAAEYDVGAYTEKQFRDALAAKNINLPEHLIKDLYNKEQALKAGEKEHKLPLEVLGIKDNIPALKQLQDLYIPTKSFPEMLKEVAGLKDLSDVTRHLTGKILHGRFTALNHPLLTWVSSTIHNLKFEENMKAGEQLHGRNGSVKQPEPGTYNYGWKQMTMPERVDVNRLGQLLNKVKENLTPDQIQVRARQLLGKELTPVQLMSYLDRVRINKQVLADINKTIVAAGREPIPELPNYWSPNVFKGPYLLKFIDKTTGETKKIISSYTEPNVKRIQKDFPEWKVELNPNEKGMRGEMDLDQIEWTLRQLDKETHDKASQAILEGLRRQGFARHGLRRKDVEGGLGTSGDRRGLREYEEVAETYIRQAYSYTSNRKLDRIYNDLASAKELNTQPNAKGFSLEAIDTARGGGNKAFDALTNILSEAVRGTIKIGSGGTLRLPQRFLHDLMQGSNKTMTTVLLGMGNIPNMIAQVLQSSLTIPKVMAEFAKSGMSTPELTLATMNAGVKAGSELVAGSKSPVIRELQRIGAFEATHRYDWSNYASKLDPHYKATLSEHLTGVSILSWLESNAVRKPAAVMFYHLLKDIGYEKIAKDSSEIYRVAKEMTDQYMVSNKWYEKPHSLSRSGIVGTTLGPLQSFSLTWLAMLREYTKLSGKGLAKGSIAKTMPLATFIGLNVMTAGMVGTVGIKEWDTIANFINDHWHLNIPTGTEWVLSKFKSTKARFGLLSDALGWHVGASLGAPSVTNSMAPGLQGLVNTGKLGYNAVASTGVFGELGKPTDAERLAPLKAMAPRPLQAPLEKMYNIPGAPIATQSGAAGPYTRTPEDWTARHFGSYSLPEVTAKTEWSTTKKAAELRKHRLTNAVNHAGDVLLAHPENINKVLPEVIKQFVKEGSHPNEAVAQLKAELISRLVEADVKGVWKGQSSKQQQIYLMLQQLR